MSAIYLIHFKQPYHHAQHYIGWTGKEGLKQRIQRHRDGQGSPLLRAVMAAGIDWQVVRTWQGATRKDERKLHNRHNARKLCPFCNPHWKENNL